jgi:hypothetical protein
VLQVQQRQENDHPLSPERVKDSLSEEDEDSSWESDRDQLFEDDITTLMDYSLVSIGGTNVVFIMHRLVQLTVRRSRDYEGSISA